MPEFWQFPTVSMGLGPLMAIYQARFLKYLHARGIANTENRKVWVFCGDGEMDEPESLGAIGLAARENLDNLIFVINCNLQRLDGPVRGNGKIIQELEGEFRGSGWNVIKLLWGRGWDRCWPRQDGAPKHLMMETLDGDYQALKANDGAFVRKNFFGRDPETAEAGGAHERRRHLELRRGGHEPEKVYAAFHAATTTQGPADRAAGQDGQGAMAWARPVKARTPCTRPRSWRRRHQVHPRPLQHPDPDSELPKTCRLQAGRRHARRCATCTSAAGPGRLFCRTAAPRPTSSSPCPRWRPSKAVLEPHGRGREISTTQAYVRFLTQLLRDQALGPRVVPILVDEARTFGMEGLFRQIGIYNPGASSVHPGGQRPGDVLPRRQGRPDPAGRHQRSRRHGSWIAAATSYSTSNRIWCRSTSTTRCSASSASATWPGRLATCRRAASCSAAPRAHHAQRRGPAARRRPQPHPGRHHSQLRELRPDLRARRSPSSSTTASSAWWKSRKRLLLHHPAQRKLRHARRPAAGTEEQIIKGMYLCRTGRAPRCRQPRNLLGSARSCANAWRPGTAGRRLGRRRPTSGAAPCFNELARATARTPSAGTCCTRGSRACPS